VQGNSKEIHIESGGGKVEMSDLSNLQELVFGGLVLARLADAAGAARAYLSRLRDASDPDVIELAELITRREEQAVEAARMEIERRAKVEALKPL
jgi:hypothetical protein